MRTVTEKKYRCIVCGAEASCEDPLMKAGWIIDSIYIAANSSAYLMEDICPKCAVEYLAGKAALLERMRAKASQKG